MTALSPQGQTQVTFPAWIYPDKRHQGGGAGALRRTVHSRAVILLSLALLSSDSSDHQLREDPGPSGLKPAPQPQPPTPPAQTTQPSVLPAVPLGSAMPPPQPLPGQSSEESWA